jgi:hypothetical protein
MTDPSASRSAQKESPYGAIRPRTGSLSVSEPASTIRRA